MRAGTRIGGAVALAAIALAGLAAPAAAQSPGAEAKRAACDISGDQTDLGASYVTSLKVRNTSCGKGEKVVKAFHACRKNNGGSDGRCNSAVEGFKCDEGKRESSPAQYNAKVVCTKGGKKVVHTYTQRT
jgi:hypothetical protein